MKIYEDINFNVPIAENRHIRYLGSLENPISKSLMDAVKKGQSVVLEISPGITRLGTIAKSNQLRTNKIIY